jgi:hypothetical protein
VLTEALVAASSLRLMTTGAGLCAHEAADLRGQLRPVTDPGVAVERDDENPAPQG